MTPYAQRLVVASERRKKRAALTATPAAKPDPLCGASRPKGAGRPEMTRYAEELLLARRQKTLGQAPSRTLTSSQAARLAPRYQPPATWDEKGLSNLSKSVSAACDRFFRRRGM